MTTCDLESAFEPGIVALELANNDVHRGTEWKVMPDRRSVVVIDCAAVQHVTRALWSGEAIFRLSSPALGKDLEAHAAKLKTLEEFLSDLEAVQEAFEGTGLQLVGLWIDRVEALEVDSRWAGEITCKVGLMEV